MPSKLTFDWTSFHFLTLLLCPLHWFGFIWCSIVLTILFMPFANQSHLFLCSPFSNTSYHTHHYFFLIKWPCSVVLVNLPDITKRLNPNGRTNSESWLILHIYVGVKFIMLNHINACTYLQLRHFIFYSLLLFVTHSLTVILLWLFSHRDLYLLHISYESQPGSSSQLN